MPSITTTIEDNSPLISYSSGWGSGSSMSDSLTSLYSQSNFMATNTNGASASFTFNGTGVQIYGAKRQNHGLFQVKVDNDLSPATNGSVTDPGLFQTLLFSKSDLQQGTHMVTITNQGGGFLDIDFITWQSSLGADDDKLFVNTVQNNDAAFTYLPSESAWSTTPPNVGSFLSGSAHATATSGASFQFEFQVRSGVALYGSVGPNNSPFSVQLDGGSTQTFNATKTYASVNTLLYRADNLGRGNAKHSLKIAYQPSSSDQVLALDYANVFTMNKPLSSLQGISSGSSSNQTHESGLGAGTIAAIVLGAFSLLLLVILMIVLIRQRKYRGPKRQRFDILPHSPTKETFAAASTSAVPLTIRQQEVPPSHSTQASSTHESQTYVSPRRELYVSNQVDESGGAYSGAVTSSSSRSMYSERSHRPEPVARNYSNSRADQPNIYQKQRPVEMPRTAGVSLAYVPEDDLRRNRSAVDGRAQDFGSTPFSPGTDILPPDYTQATEPYRP